MKSLFTKKKFHSIFLILLLFFAIATIGTTLSKYIIVEYVGEFNLRIEPQGQAYAVYSNDDNSLDFYFGIYPETGTTLPNGKTADIVYHDKIETNETTTPEWNEVASQVKSVNFVDVIMPASTSGWFSGFTNATSFNLTKLNTANTTNMANMFTNCLAIETLTLGENFGNAEQTFTDVGLNKSITGWTKESENNETDYLCSNISLGVAETYTSVTYCYATLGYDNQTLSIYQRKYVPAVNETYDGHKIKKIYSWRNGDSKSSYTTSEGCRPPRIDTSNIYNNWSPGTSSTSYQTDILGVSVIDNIKPLTLKNWFKNYVNLGYNGEIIDLAKLDTSAVTDMSYMFYNCNKPKTINISHFNTTQVIDMSFMFSKCFDLINLDLSSFDTSNVTNMTSMFDMEATTSTSDLLTIYASDSFVTTNVTSSTNMFNKCYTLKGGNGTTLEKTGGSTDCTYAKIDKVGQLGYFTEKTSG